MTQAIAKSGLSPSAARAGARFETVNGWHVAMRFDAVETEQKAARERVALVDVSAVGKSVIQGRSVHDVLAAQFGAAPAEPTELVRFDAGWLTRMNRYEYYAVLPLSQVDQTVDALRSAYAGMHAHVTSVTHGRDAIAVIGPRASDTLSKLCALDFHERTFSSGRAQISSVAKVTALIARVDRAGLPCYEIHLDRSFSEYVWEAVLDAAEEFAGRAIGLEALDRLSATEPTNEFAA